MFRKTWNRLSPAKKNILSWLAVAFPACVMAAFWLIFRESFTLRALLDSLLTGMVALAMYAALVFFILVLYSGKKRPREQP